MNAHFLTFWFRSYILHLSEPKNLVYRRTVRPLPVPGFGPWIHILDLMIDHKFSDSVNLEESDEHTIKWSDQIRRIMRLQQDHGEKRKCRKDCQLDFRTFRRDLNASQSVLLSSMQCDKNEILLWIHNMLKINKLIYLKFI